MIRIIIMIGLMIHGLIHLLGFVVPWRLATVDGLTYKTTVLAGRFDVGERGTQIIGLLWFVAAVGFVAAGIAVLTLHPWWPALVLSITLLSLVITILGWPEAQIGVLINLIILALWCSGQAAIWLQPVQ
jgi:hypothetical protein